MNAMIFLMKVIDRIGVWLSTQRFHIRYWPFLILAKGVRINRGTRIKPFYNIIKKSKKNGCDTNAIWNCSTTLILTLISILAFKNKVSKFKLIGMFAAIVSIFFIEYKN